MSKDFWFSSLFPEAGRMFSVLLFCGQSATGISQYAHQTVVPGLSGQELQLELKKRYKPPFTLDYSVARDTLFAKVDAVGDSLMCVYTGMTLPLRAGQDPTETVYLGGIPNGINTEHSWPQGKGAIGQAQSDMHHLFPSRIKTNADRADHPFGNIPDPDTKIWYLKATERTSPPATLRDLYSEYVPGKFEPREQVKGNIARAIFYFYTVYRDLAEASDPAYFGLMRDGLCEWHYQDPVDQAEWLRNKKIASYQGGRENPFILDCSLVSRAYCNNIDQACEALLSSVINPGFTKPEVFAIFPNPGSGRRVLRASSLAHESADLMCLNLSGQVIFEQKNVNFDSQGMLVLPDNHLASGCYILRCTSLKLSSPVNLLFIQE